MKLKTSLQLSAIIPILFAIIVVLILKWHFGSISESLFLDTSLMALFGLLGVTMGAIILSYSRDILKKIGILNNWANAVLKGNLDHRVDLDPSNDEIGQLSQTLCKMLKELKDAYVDLQQEANRHKEEVLQHKKGTEASKIATNHLTNTLMRMKKSQENMVWQERMNVLEQIIRGTTHDLSEAMMPIVGTCDLLVSHPETLDDRTQVLEHLKIIQGGAERLKKLLKHLSSYFHAAEETAGPTDANYIVKEVVEFVKPYWEEQAGTEGRKIEMRTSLEVVPAVAAEANDLRDSLINLIVNSVEAMPDGGVITISTCCNQSFVLIDVRDTGGGMSKIVRKRCLEPFYSTKEGVGTGMGLTIVNSMVQRYKGILEIESEPNTGTRVSLGLPIWTKEVEADAKTVAEEKVSGKLRILVVDDDPSSLMVVAKILTSEKHIVEIAASGAEGIEKMKSQKFDVAIIDRAMPDMSGDELAVAIKEISQETSVMMLTGFGGIMTEESEIPANVDAIVSKPMTIKELHDGLVTAMLSKEAKPSRPSRKKAVIKVGAGMTPLRESMNITHLSDAAERSREGDSIKWID